MKINKAKLLVGTLAIVATAATVGSISGTVAWFQYNTRAVAEFSGATAHCTESLELSVDNTAWYTRLSATTINAAITRTSVATKNTLRPVTSGALAVDSAAEHLYTNPVYQYAGEYPTTTPWSNANWKAATNDDYVEFPLYIRVKDLNGSGTAVLKSKPIYLSDVTIAAKAGDMDVSPAVRVAVWNSANYASPYGTYSQLGEDVNTYGPLDLNADNKNDKAEKYSFETEGADLVYGTASSVAKSYANTDLATGTSDHKLADDTDPEAIKGLQLGTTGADGAALQIKVRIYLEGWTTLLDGGKYFGKLPTTSAPASASNGDYYYDTTTSKWMKYTASWAVDGTGDTDPRKPMWDIAKAITSTFDVGMQFSTNLHHDTDHVA